MSRFLTAALLAASLPASLAAASDAPGAAQPAQDELKRLTIEELMRIDVTTAARREQPVGATPAAISVITGDDIRRAGVTTLADALQLADGVHVARAHGSAWRISARGFNGATPNKLLVMIDGRTVYSPLFTGVFWNTLDYPLDDIDRIEVIRGPGAVLWGANAVNGVVNIITRHTRDTQGTLLSASSGTEHPGIAAVRYGGRAGVATWRAYGKFAAADDQRLASGLPAQDAWRRGQVGFRMDASRGGTAWLLKADAFQSREDLPGLEEGEFSDLSIQGRWSRTASDGARVDVQSYYRRESRRVPGQLTHHIDVVDLDAQHMVTLGGRHDVVWGGGVRYNADDTEPGGSVRFEPEDRRYGLVSAFVQDEVALVPGRLFATLGVKYEHNNFSGGELQPNVRGRLMMARNQVLWGAVSRAVRRPTRLDDDVVVPAPDGTIRLRGTHQFQAETLTATEVGYRIQPSPLLSLDATVFWHEYDDLRSQDAPIGAGPVVLGNTLEGRSRGVEVGVNVQPVPWWRTHAGYTRLETTVRREPGSRDVSGGAAEANDPDHLFTLRSALDLPAGIEVDAIVRAVGALPTPPVPGYGELTLRAGWRPRPAVEISVVGQDLLHEQHPEFGAPGPDRVELQRSVRVGVTFRY